MSSSTNATPGNSLGPTPSQQQYFHQLKSKLTLGLQKAQKHTGVCHDVIATQLTSDRIKMPQQPRPLPLKMPSEPKQEATEEQKMGVLAANLEQLKHKKQQAMLLLKQLSNEQLMLRKKQLLSNSPSNNDESPKQKLRSVFTTEDNKVLGSLLQKNRKFEQRLEEKSRKAEEEERKQRLVEEQQREEERNAKRAERRKRLLGIQQHASERLIRVNSETGHSSSRNSVVRENYYYQKLEEEARRIERLARQEKEQAAKEANRAKRFLDIQDILDHQKKYRDRVFQQSSRPRLVSQNIQNTPKIYPQGFYSKLMSEERASLEKLRKERIERPFEYQHKIVEYTKEIKQKYRPIPSPKKSEELSLSFIPTVSREPLDRETMKGLGQNYFELSKKLMKPQQDALTASQLSKLQSTTQQQKQLENKYPDYMQQSKPRHSYSPQKDLEKVKKLVQKSPENAKNEAEKLHLEAGRSPERLAASIHAKLLVLDTLKK